jgi:two-component system nitrate/nitrite response regulator NarL
MVIEPRSLVREALVSLLTSHSCHVVGELSWPSEIEKSTIGASAPKLVILSALPVDEAVNAAGRIRTLWSDAKIILLLDCASRGDFARVLASEIDGCVPLFASLDTLIDTLKTIIATGLRILVLRAETSVSEASHAAGEEAHPLHPASYDPNQVGDVENGLDASASLRMACGLSQREEEILKGVVRGHSNKIIARACGVTDATIKVHMKSILRKIRVANRTQAAVWALERGYGADVTRRPSATRQASHEIVVT